MTVPAVYVDLPFWLAIVFMLGGLWLLVWSANLFVDGAEAVARSFGVSPFIIGMVVIGFGTSAPELAVSAISAGTGHSNLSLGNVRLKHLQHRRHTRNCGDDPSPVGQAAGGVRGVTAVGWNSAPVLSACLRRWRILPLGRHHPVGDFRSPFASLLLARQEIEECECVCELCACGKKTTLLGCLVWRACPTRGIVASAGVGSSFGGTVAWRFGAIDRSHYRCGGYIASGTGVGHSLGAERPKRLRARQHHRIEFLQYACRGRFERHDMPVQGRVTPRSLARFAGYGSLVAVHWLFRDQLPETIWRWADCTP